MPPADLVSALLVPVLLALPAPADEPISADDLEFFESRIRPVLVEHCYRCHSADAERIRGDYRLDTADLMRDGPSGPAIVPGDPDASLLIQAIRYDDEFLEMPPKQQLEASVIADFERWVRRGAPDPRVAHAAPAPEPLNDVTSDAARAFWSFVAPTRPDVPSVTDATWPRTPLDHFVLAELEARDLDPVRDADRAALARRLSFDLVGLPPSPDALDAFVRDRAPDAVERYVDALLESPHFGERWGRHWLDVARYAESSGQDSNVLYPHAWRYRDYVIDAFNRDVPYDLFVREQIAGDLMPARNDGERARQMIATGFLAVGTKSHTTAQRAQFAMDLVDEQINAVTQGMLGLTVACARCHDHKFDPIPTRDYYALAGIFLSTETCYGTVRGGGNRQPSDVLTLPAGAIVATSAPLTDAQRSALERQYERTQEQVETLTTQLRENGRGDGQAAARLRIARGQLTTLESILARYDADGVPTAAARVALGVRDTARPRDATLLERGELDQPRERVPRGFPQLFADMDVPPIRAGSGRLELADWIGSPLNPLTARVWVNRVWHHLMGAPIVPTPDNFGTTGLPPSHPALLDHLAITFMDDDGWSTKALIRRIVLSRTYQLGAHFDRSNHAVDPENVYRWRYAPRRLDAEAIRDAMLVAAGTLDDHPPLASPIAALEGTSRAMDRIAIDEARERTARSVYLPIVRDQVPEALAVFDFADPSFVTGQRETTNVPNQALYMLNSDEVIALADAMAQRLLALDASDEARLEHAFRLAFGREPARRERAAAKQFFETFASTQPAPSRDTTRVERRRRAVRERVRGAARGDDATASAALDRRTMAWSAFCQSLFASAEFRTLN